MEELPRPVEPEDVALDALLALRARRDTAQGESGATLQALGLELAPHERYLSAVCDAHGRFHLLWRDPPPMTAPSASNAPAKGRSLCRRDCRVDFAYAPAQPLE